LSLKPQPDGTLRGAYTGNIETNECGNQGATIVVPVVATRIGDVPPGVTVQDPAKVVDFTPPPTTTPPPPVPIRLGETCDSDLKLAVDLTASTRVICQGGTWVKAPQISGVNITGTPRTDPSMVSMSYDGYVIECDPATKNWTRQQG